jgi:cytochrome P450
MSTTATHLAPVAPIPGPRPRWWGLPLLAAMRRDYLGYCEALQREHGDLVASRIVVERALDVFHPALVREVLVDHAPTLVRWERGVEVFGQLMGQSVLVTEGATWQRQRRMLHGAFTPRQVAGYATLMTDAARAGLDRLHAAAEPPGAEQDLAAWFSGVAMDVILRTLFGQPAADRGLHRIAADVQTLSETALKEMFWPATLPDWLPLPGKAAKRAALKRLRALIAHHIDRPAPGEHLLAQLLALRDEQAGGQPLSRAEVFDQCMVSFQAGHETSATALAWWSVLMARHPQAAARARDEVDTVLRGSVPGADVLQQLPWLGATLKEAMRLYPPIAAVLTRRNRQAITLGGHAVPARTLLRITPWVLHRDPRWFSEPGAFRPERFMPGAPPIERGAYMPFGAGPRVCLGQHFAQLEMTLIAAMLLQRFELVWPAGQPEPRPVLNVTLRPSGARLVVRRRGVAA